MLEKANKCTLTLCASGQPWKPWLAEAAAWLELWCELVALRGSL